jgi:hypothetical protein
MNKNILPFIFLLALVKVDAQKIFTLAGNGIAGFSGDGGPAYAAKINTPFGVAIDKQGNTYISDSQNNRIRKVTPGGIISTFAGTGVAGLSGDSGAAISAKLNQPCGITVDTAGNVFFADRINHRIRMINKLGIIYTVAGSVSGFFGDGGPATSARLTSPGGVAVDRAGNIYIADTNNDRIRKVGTNDTIMTIAGGGTLTIENITATRAVLATPRDVAVDTLGNVFFTDSNFDRVRKVNAIDSINTIAGTGVYGFAGDGGPATSAQLREPYSVDVDAAGNIFIADLHNWRIRKVTSTGTITTIAGSNVQGYGGDGGFATAAALYGPTSVVVNASGDIYIADDFNERIRKVCMSACLAGVQYYDEQEKLFSLYPNPNSGSFNLDLHLQSEKAKFTLINILGQTAFEQEVLDGNNFIQTFDIAKGIYQYALIENNSITKTGKVLIE